MKTLLLLLATPLLLTLLVSQLNAGSGEEESKPAKSDADKIFERLSKAIGGEWVTEAGFKDPTANHARFAVTKGAHDRVLHDRTWLVLKGEAKPLYDGMFFWNPKSSQMEYIEVEATGGLSKGTISLEGDTEVSLFTEYSAGKESEFKQVSKYRDNDTMESHVYRKENGEWKETHNFVFHRVKKEEQPK